MTAAPLPRHRTRPGTRFPAGATLTPEGVNFSVYSRQATAMELLLYEAHDSAEPYQVIVLDPEINRSYHFWHVFVEGLKAGVHYTWRADGPDDTAQTGRCFNARKELLDPWARAVTDTVWDRRRASDATAAGHVSMRAVVSDPEFDWRGEKKIARGLEGAVIYEMHVGGFTRHPSSRVKHPGTFSGVIEKIPYLRDLGITHVELMPVMAFDEQDVPAAVAARGLKNYWGYSTHSFRSPHPRYCVQPERGAHAREFKEMVKALHAAGIGVILDVVLNHTAEGGAGGPWINFKGLANETFYLLDPADRRRYLDFTGCGNTVNCNHPLVTAFLIHALEYWVEKMHVDGFRFDLASAFARGENGVPLSNPPFPWAIELSRTLAELPLIAEAWDAAGLYHVGAYPGLAWHEWNGRYRDVIRDFVRGVPGMVREAATRIAGSSDLYADDGRLPVNSINFVTCHDGFTLRDLVSYGEKHNEANGEGNRDGSEDNRSWNCGVEGETTDVAINRLRRRQARNFMAILMLSRGVPMILAGDELLRTQHGNNNAWCQDNDISWIDWRLLGVNHDMYRFTRGMIAFRRRHPCLTCNRFFKGRPVPGRDLPDIAWHGLRLHEPLWDDPQARVLAFTIAGVAPGEEDLHVVLNMSERAFEAPLPNIPGRRWHLAVDTCRSGPDNLIERDRQTPWTGERCTSHAHSVLVFEAR